MTVRRAHHNPPTPKAQAHALQAKVKKALSNGRVTEREATALVKAAKKDGISGKERRVLKRALVHQNDFFEPAAQKRLAKVAHFKPGANIATNAPEQVRAEYKRLAHDGSFDAFDAGKLIHRINQDGETEGERLALDALLKNPKYQMDDDARVRLQHFVRDTEPVVGPTTVSAGGVTIQANGVRQSAIDEMTRIANGMTAARPDIAGRLAESRVKVVIVPAGVKLTDLPEFASLKGTFTFDGRPFDDVRGVANVVQPDGSVAVAVPEENLSRLTQDGYGNESVGIHEFAHAIQQYGVTPEERDAIEAQFNAVKGRGGPFPNDYANSNSYEFFAELSAGWFDRFFDPNRDASWIQQNLPEMYGILERIYGAPRKIIE